MVNKYYQKYKERLRKTAKDYVKYIKIFLKKKKTKSEKRPEKDIKILLKKKKRKRRQERHYYQERKQKLPENRTNYYLAHKK